MIYGYAFLLFAACVGAAYVRARVHLVRLHRYEKSANDFWQKAQPLLSDADTPLPVLDTLAFVNKKITTAKSSWALIAAMVLVRNGHAPAVDNSEMKAFFARRPELAPAFYGSVASGMLAITYSSLFSGYFARRLIGNLVRRHPEVAPAVAESVMHDQRCLAA
ncbi:hypothetical protein V5F72_01310 [Xanthobacter flavus]|uniref:hypothetical protein n=1 Tax=Xanthobacter flavus TaxID=281 RepID=UPI00372AA262